MKKDIDAILTERAEKAKAISDVISDIAFHFKKEDLKKSEDDIKKVCDFYVNECNHDDDYYMTQTNLICYRFNKVPAKPWLMGRDRVQKWDIFITESIFNGLFHHWVYEMIQLHEDISSGGQADKEKFITTRLLQAIDVQENISLYEEYKDKPGKQAYWSPRYFKDTHQVKVEFVSWWMCTDMSKYVK